ncbi:Fanconi anemia group I protein-like [Anopheles merus]|uniref:Fanconi anemia group I protein-like n=1 Tax=Anopheles merus TaxID=30066 RepID=UPI001BE451FE|nr:Fanconi anemia group I protein-like [Anopheles merus]XP_041787410.1 Fanconi anemia group I protein-like [Anopheles merus]
MPPNLMLSVIKLGQKRQNDELKELLEKLPSSQLIDMVVSNIDSIDGYTLWHFTLLGLASSDRCTGKRFELVMAVLQHLNVVELSTKQVFDLIARLLTDLPSLTPEQLVEICELCIESIRAGDPKCLTWKHLLPQTLLQLSGNSGRLNANGMLLTGAEYRQKVLEEIFKMKLQLTILTALCGMFRDLSLSKDETSIFVTKVSDSLKNIEPLELPPLACQLFHVCLKHPSLLVVPLMALQKYFHKNYYKKVLSNENSDTTDFDSIDRYSDSEIREAEETILFHLSNVTEFRVDEAQTVAMFKPFQNNPEVLLTPFLVGALLAMSKINRQPDTTDVVSSPIMAFLIKLIAISEQEREMCSQSAWCRGRIEPSVIARIDQLFSILTENSQEGKEVVTPGLINFAFALLLAKKQPKLHGIAINFFQLFIKRRFIFGSGIIAKIKKYLFADLEESQFNTCLTTLSLTNALTVSECTNTIQFIMDYLLLINGTHAMRFMAFIFPLLRISHTIRDRYIEVLRKAMYNGETSTRIMGVFGFCSLLKQLKNNNARRSIMGSGGGNYTQLTISGMSLLSQAVYGSQNNPNVHFDMLTLEIMGMLRKCFTQTLEVRQMLYEALGRAVEFNTQLLPHVLQFIDWHFESFFGENPKESFRIDFDKCVRYKGEMGEDYYSADEQRPIVVYDNVGRLTAFMVHCVVLCDQHDVQHDTGAVRSTLQLVVERIDNLSVDDLGIAGTLDAKSLVIATQYLNMLEAAMAYCAYKTQPDNVLLRDFVRLFKHHQHCVEKFKKMEPKKGNKKQISEASANASTLNASSKTGISFKPENIWDLATVERMLHISLDTMTNYGKEEDLKIFRGNRDLQQYILKIACQKLESLRSMPDYWQVNHSKRIFGHLAECTKLVYDRCIKKTTELIGNGGLLVAQAAVECFRQGLISAVELYERKFNDFLQLICCTIGPSFKKELFAQLQTIVDECFKEGSEPEPIGEKIVVGLLQCLELLYKSSVANQDHLTQGYDWLQNFCINTKLKQKSFAIIHRLLFDLRIRTQTGAYFDSIAMRLELKFGQIAAEETSPLFYFKSITSATAEPTFHYLCAIFRQQLEEIEHLILRTNSLMIRLKVFGLDDTDETSQLLKSIERSICSQLVHILGSLTHLCNANLPLGATMDALIKLLLLVYGCLANLSKHFLARHAIVPIAYDVTKFNLVVKSSKPLASKIYDLIPFVEENIIGQDEGDEPVNSAKAKSNRDKVLRQTKLIPKLVFRIETFNKIVMQLSKKTKKDLTYLLHMGTVRDFRIKTSALVEAIQRTVTDRTEMDEDEEAVEPQLDPDNADDDGDDDDGEGSINHTACSNRSEVTGAVKQTRANKTSLSAEALALKNLAKLNERTRKAAKKRALEHASEEVEVDPPVASKKAKAANRKSASGSKINKRALEDVSAVQNVENVEPGVQPVTRTRTLGLPRRSARKNDT